MQTSSRQTRCFNAVVFDMGDVFFDATHWRRRLTEHLNSRGLAIGHPDLCRKWEEKLVDVYVGQRAYWDAFDEFLRDLGQTSDEIKQTVDFARQVAAQVESRTLFEGVSETLAHLDAEGIRLAILSDTESNEPTVRRRLADLSIEGFFDAVVTSIDIGYVKPQPESYQIAMQRLDSEAGQTLFVGHDEEELVGAMECGMTAVAFNSDGAVRAHHWIDSFRELCELVK